MGIPVLFLQVDAPVDILAVLRPCLVSTGMSNTHCVRSRTEFSPGGISPLSSAEMDCLISIRVEVSLTAWANHIDWKLVIEFVARLFATVCVPLGCSFVLSAPHAFDHCHLWFFAAVDREHDQKVTTTSQYWFCRRMYTLCIVPMNCVSTNMAYIWTNWRFSRTVRTSPSLRDMSLLSLARSAFLLAISFALGGFFDASENRASTFMRSHYYYFGTSLSRSNSATTWQQLEKLSSITKR